MAKYFRVNNNNSMAPCSLLSRNNSGDLICNILTALAVETELPLLLLLGWAVGFHYQKIPEHYFIAGQAVAPSPRISSIFSSSATQPRSSSAPSPRACPHFCCATACPRFPSSSRPASQSFFSSQSQVFIFFHVIPYSATTSNLPRASMLPCLSL